MTFATTNRRGKRLPLAVERVIERLALESRSAKQIHAEISADPNLAVDCPDIRTIQRRLHEFARRDQSESWRLSNASAEEVAAVLRVLPAIIERTRGGIGSVTTAEAACLARLATAAQGLTDWERYVFARAYAKRHEANDPTVDLDAFLAYQPWVSKEKREAYARAVAQGYVAPAVGYLKGRLSDPRWEDAITERDRIIAANKKAIKPYLNDIRSMLEDNGTHRDEQQRGP